MRKIFFSGIFVLVVLFLSCLAFFSFADLSDLKVDPGDFRDTVSDVLGSDVLGVFKLNPSFRVSLDYDLGDYDFVKVRVSEIISACEGRSDDFEGCVRGKLDSFSVGGWVWGLDCDSADKKVFNDFADFMMSCVQSLDDKCLCESKAYSDEDIKKFFLKGDYVLSVSQRGFSGVGGVYNYSFLRLNESVHNVSNVSINYLDSGVFKGLGSVNYSVGFGVDDFVDGRLVFVGPGGSDDWSGVDRFVFLKNVSVLSFVKGSDVVKFSSLPKCESLRKVFRVCAVNNRYNFTSFSKKFNQVVSVPVTYKFALFFDDVVAPAQLSGLVVSDVKDAEMLVNLSWLASSDVDVKEYRFFFNFSAFDNASDAIRLGLVVPHVSGVEVYNVSFKVPDDGVPYFFAVVAVDKFGNENLSVVSVSGVSVDDLPPGPVADLRLVKVSDVSNQLELRWDKPVNNTDGSVVLESDEELSYTIFKKEGSSIQRLNLVPIISGVKDKFYVVSGLDPFKTYYFVVVARDELGNPVDSFLTQTDVGNNPYGFVQVSSSSAVSE